MPKDSGRHVCLVALFTFAGFFCETVVIRQHAKPRAVCTRVDLTSRDRKNPGDGATARSWTYVARPARGYHRPRLGCSGASARRLGFFSNAAGLDLALFSVAPRASCTQSFENDVQTSGAFFQQSHFP